MTIFKNFTKIETLVPSSKKAASIFWYMCNKFLLAHPRSNGNDLEWGFCFGMDLNFTSKVASRDRKLFFEIECHKSTGIFVLKFGFLPGIENRYFDQARIRISFSPEDL